MLFRCLYIQILFIFLETFHSSTAPALGEAGPIINGPLTIEQSQQLVEQNNQLRQRLKDFNLALDRALRNTGTSSKAAGNARMFQTVQDAELANLHKRLDMLRRENEQLKMERRKDPALDRVTELENELRAAQASERAAKDEARQLVLELKRVRKSLADAPEALRVLQAREAQVEEKLKKYKEYIKLYRAKHDRDQRDMRAQQATMVDLDNQLRALKGSYAPLVLPQLSPSLDSLGAEIDDLERSGASSSSSISNHSSSSSSGNSAASPRYVRKVRSPEARRVANKDKDQSKDSKNTLTKPVNDDVSGEQAVRDDKGAEDEA